MRTCHTITLYRCAHAIVRGAAITCDRGHRLNVRGDGAISLKRLIRGEEMCLAVCQGCLDFDNQGPTPKKVDRGWTPNQHERDLIRPRNTDRKRTNPSGRSPKGASGC